MENDFMRWFGLTIPIVQAPIGGASNTVLATEVGRAGGMGALALTWTAADLAAEQIATLNAAAVAFYVNFVLRFGTAAIESAAKCEPPAITLSWGIDADAILLVKSHGVKVGVQVATPTGAVAAIEAGADYLIAQGIEAGGHVQSSTALHKLLADVIEVAGTVPVLAAGGVARASDIAACLAQGAQAVVMGTRFVVTTESSAHEVHKHAIVEASVDCTSYTNCFDGDFPYAMHRVLRNSTLDAWEAAGSPQAPNRPGEGDVILYHGATPILRYGDTGPLAGATGDVEAGCLYAGIGATHIDKVEPAGVMMQRLWAETVELRSRS